MEKGTAEIVSRKESGCNGNNHDSDNVLSDVQRQTWYFNTRARANHSSRTHRIVEGIARNVRGCHLRVELCRWSGNVLTAARVPLRATVRLGETGKS